MLVKQITSNWLTTWMKPKCLMFTQGVGDQLSLPLCTVIIAMASDDVDSTTTSVGCQILYVLLPLTYLQWHCIWENWHPEPRPFHYYSSERHHEHCHWSKAQDKRGEHHLHMDNHNDDTQATLMHSHCWFEHTQVDIWRSRCVKCPESVRLWPKWGWKNKIDILLI